MVRLLPMTDEDFEQFMEISMRDQAQGQVMAGTWTAEEADERIQELRAQFLPDDQATPNHFFYRIEDQGAGRKVGGLWYTIVEGEGGRQVFVVDIQVYDAYRRQGYGTRAFRIMEEQVREMGVPTISLHVFNHNRAARAMYEKLGYTGSGAMMFKDLPTSAR